MKKPWEFYLSYTTVEGEGEAYVLKGLRPFKLPLINDYYKCDSLFSTL